MKSHLIIFSTLSILFCAILLSTRFKSPSNLSESPIQNPSLNAPNLEVFGRPKINLEDYSPAAPKIKSPFSISEHSREGEPIYSPPPNMPPHAEKSGHCIYELQVNPKGKVQSVLSLTCSDEVFVEATRLSLLKWQFIPKTGDNDQAQPFQYGPNRLFYRLTDVNGEITPE